MFSTGNYEQPHKLLLDMDNLFQDEFYETKVKLEFGKQYVCLLFMLMLLLFLFMGGMEVGGGRGGGGVC